MKFVVGLVLVLITVVALSMVSAKPVVAWYVVAKHLNLTDFFLAAEAYRPDVVLLTVYAEDDVVPFNGSYFPLEEFVDRLREKNIKVFYSFSLFSRSALPFEAYMALNESGIPFEEMNISVGRYARFLREQTDDYGRVFSYWKERGLDPETVPLSERKPVEGFYVEPGHYTSINPLFRPYRDFIKKVIQETVERKQPDGLAIDHGRFFTFDEGFNADIRMWMGERGLELGNYTPKPMFQITNWTEEDRTYYDGRAALVTEAVADILPVGLPVWGTTMGVTEPARSNGQYVELQARNYQKLLLMAYDTDSREVERNVRATGGGVILGLFPFENYSQVLENLEAGRRGGAGGYYLLGYRFPAIVHKRLLWIRGR